MHKASPEIDWEKILTAVSSCKPIMEGSFRRKDSYAVASKVTEFATILKGSEGVTDGLLAYSFDGKNVFFSVLFRLTPKETHQELAYLHEGPFMPTPESLRPLGEEARVRIRERHNAAAEILCMPYTLDLSPSDPHIYLGQSQIPSALGEGLHGRSLLSALNREPQLRTNFPKRFVRTLFRNL